MAKISGARVAAFLKDPGPDMAGILVYGPDRGLVRERAEALVEHAAGDRHDPFQVARLSGADIKADPARLGDEAASMSLTGGRRAVWVQDVTDAAADPFKALLAAPPGDALVVAEAAALGPRSTLRRAFEGARRGAAVACYEDDARSLSGVIRETLREHGLNPAPDALQFLIGHLGSDRLVSRRELEKLALYKGAPGEVTLDDAVAAVGDSGAVSLDAVAYATGGGDQAALDTALNRVFNEGENPVAVLRAASRHFQRLHLAAAMVHKGEAADQAMKALRPPVIFKFAAAFRRQLGLWPAARLGDALELLTETEIACKTTGMPAEALCRRALMRLAQASARRTRH